MKVPAPRKLSSGNWYIYMRLNGTGVSVTDRSKAACVAKARSIKARYKADELDIGSHASKDTLGGIIDRYISKYTPVLSPSTVRGYGIIRRNRFKDYMSLNPEKINWQKMINEESEHINEKTIQNAWGLVGASLKDAGIPVPSVKLAPAPVHGASFLQPEEIKPFLKEIEGEKAELLLLLELHGLRYSEARALTWDDVDLDRKLLHVRSAVVPDASHHYVKKNTTKNRTSTRDVPIMIPRLVDVLKPLEGQEGTLVTMHPLTGQRCAERASRRAGVTIMSNHSLRKSFASLCYHLGIPERQIMELGGWSNTTTMHKIYIQITNTDREKASARLSHFFEE